MRTVASKQNQPQERASSSTAPSNVATPGPVHREHPLFHLQRTIGNQALQRMLPPRIAIQTKLAVNEPGDQYEKEADRVADQVMRMTEPGTVGGPAERGPEQLQMKRAGPADVGRTEAPPIVHEVLRSPGQPLDPATRAFMEPRFGHDFGGIRVHSGDLAGESARAANALAYTVGRDVVFGAGQYAPQTHDGRRLLAHELAHTMQQNATPMALLQRQPAAAGPATPNAPRKDFVFIMGADPKRTSNPFFSLAAQYFRAHVPGATLVQDQRNLAGLLNWISSNVADPIGDLYIVSHGNEDGTLAFGLNSSDKDGHMSVIELRDALHPPAGGASTLPSVSSVVDAQTKIHIKGCDIGRTREIVELIDEAFGGAGTVTAPTHEQGYSTDPALGKQARGAAHDEQIAGFTAGLPELPAEPAPIAKNLKGDALKQAKREHDDAVAERKKAKAARKQSIAGEEKRIKPDLDAVDKLAATVDSLSGPMFQRPGTKLFTAKEIRPEVDRLYGHLPEARRKNLAEQLAAPDRGLPNDQQGQKVVRVKPFSQPFIEPASLAEAKAQFANDFKTNKFEPRSMAINRTPGADGTELEMIFTGISHPSGADAFQSTLTFTETVPDDATIIANGKANTNNPDRYEWRVERKARSGKTTLTAVGERVLAYLHHGSLDANPHDRFSQPEGNPDFYATSSFTPPTPAATP